MQTGVPVILHDVDENNKLPKITRYTQAIRQIFRLLKSVPLSEITSNN